MVICPGPRRSGGHESGPGRVELGLEVPDNGAVVGPAVDVAGTGQQTASKVDTTSLGREHDLLGLSFLAFHLMEGVVRAGARLCLVRVLENTGYMSALLTSRNRTYPLAVNDVVSLVTALIHALLRVEGDEAEASTPGCDLVNHYHNFSDTSELPEVLAEVILAGSMLDSTHEDLLRFGDVLQRYTVRVMSMRPLYMTCTLHDMCTSDTITTYKTQFLVTFEFGTLGNAFLGSI